MSGINLGNLTFGLDSLLQPTLELVGEKLRDYVERKIGSASPENLWTLIPAFSYYANFVAPVAHAIRHKHVVHSNGSKRHLNPLLDRLQINLLDLNPESLQKLTGEFISVEVESKPRSFQLLTRDVNSPSLTLIDFPPVFRTLGSIQLYLKFKDEVVSSRLEAMQTEYAQQLSDFLEQDDDNRPLILLQTALPKNLET